MLVLLVFRECNPPKKKGNPNSSPTTSHSKVVNFVFPAPASRLIDGGNLRLGSAEIQQTSWPIDPGLCAVHKGDEIVSGYTGIIITLQQTKIAMENGPFEDDFGIFHCYVSLPECKPL